MKQQAVPPGMPGDQKANGQNEVRDQWLSWFTWATNGVNSLVDSGDTTGRPTKIIWVGRQYFDTDLGIPIWYSGGGVWVDATGTPV